MASMALSERLLVLTGRFSIFRARDAVSREFIELVERDEIHHWRLGRLPLVSGDDKSTWYYVLKNRGKMLYVPDVKAVSFESLPAGRSFLAGTGELMRRWYGNMLRANAKAVRLGPRVCGPFTWWSLIDQRLSMWTALMGPTAALVLALHGTMLAPVFYLLWVLSTRSVMALVDGLFWGRVYASWPFLMFFNQVWGAWLRTCVLFRPDRQGWTRQGVGFARRRTAADVVASALLHGAAVSIFVLIVGVGLGVLPDFSGHLVPALRLVMAP
jgi:glycosyltransferase Alg8